MTVANRSIQPMSVNMRVIAPMGTCKPSACCVVVLLLNIVRFRKQLLSDRFMIIFINEEHSYLYWLAHHPAAYVLDTRRRPSENHLVLHRATCSQIKSSETKKTHWTTGGRAKACALDLAELESWADEMTDSAPVYCEQCRPNEVLTMESLASDANHPNQAHLTKLGSEILDYVVDIAVIFLDGGDTIYCLTVADIAQCFRKTPAQPTGALLRLLEDGYVDMEGQFNPGEPLPDDRMVYPTQKSLRRLPAFKRMKNKQLNSEMERLRVG